MPVLLEKIQKELKNLRNTNDYDILDVSKLAVQPMKGVKTVTYKANVKGGMPRRTPGSSAKRKKKLDYQTMVQFLDVEFMESPTDETITATYNKQPYYFKIPDVREKFIKLKCSCQDFRFMWEKQLWDEKGLIGKFRSYTRKTLVPPGDPKGRPPVNPDEYMGYCKHMHSTLEKLREKKKIIGLK